MELNQNLLQPVAKELSSGEQDLIQYIDSLCKVIEKLNPEIQAILPEEDRRSRLMTAARAIQSQHVSRDLPPLWGIPVGIKDIIHVDGFPTKGGSKIPAEAIGGPEAAIVRRFREGGAIIAGKTVTTEFAMSAPGPTRNPHATNHTPGGSSSGSAAAVAAGLCPLAVGTQTNGSIIRPASFCGVVGYKPSFGRIPTEGLLTLSPSADHVGLYTQDVDGLEIAASVACEGWSSTEQTGTPKIAITDGKYLDQASDTARKAINTAASTLESAGYTVVKEVAFDDINEVYNAHNTLTTAETTLTLFHILDEFEEDIQDITVNRITEGADVEMVDLALARENRISLRKSLKQKMADTGIDLWISPASVGPAPEGIDDTGDPRMNQPWTHCGFPTVSVPMDTSDELPIGLQISAPFWDDEQLISWASEIASIVKPDTMYW